MCKMCLYLYVFTPLSQFLYLIGDVHVTGYKELAYTHLHLFIKDNLPGTFTTP